MGNRVNDLDGTLDGYCCPKVEMFYFTKIEMF